MDAKYFREKSQLCFRLADGLSLNNPGRFQLMDLGDDFISRAKELERLGGGNRIGGLLVAKRQIGTQWL